MSIACICPVHFVGAELEVVIPHVFPIRERANMANIGENYTPKIPDNRLTILSWILPLPIPLVLRLFQMYFKLV